MAAKLQKTQNFFLNDEAMSDYWENLFKYIRACGDDGEVNLRDSDDDLYDFANEILMPRMRERLVEEIQRRAYSIGYLRLGNKFFMTMNEQQQQSFFRSIFSLWLQKCSISVGEATDNSTESPAITISTPALLETLHHLNKNVWRLIVNNFALTCQSDVQELSNTILSKCDTLRYLSLDSIECPLDESNRDDSDESDGFLDPLFDGASGLESFCVSTKTRSVHSTLVSPTALRALFVEGKDGYELNLRGLGLNDSHVLAIVDGLSTPGIHFDYLNLESNPCITAQGYDALLNLINRANVVGYVSVHFGEWRGFCVPDKAWEVELNLVSEMNSAYSRLDYLTNGTFTSEERKCQWLEELADRIRREEFSDRGIRELLGRKKKRDAKHVNFIWYTLCQNPEMMQGFQAQTGTKKRKFAQSTLN
jgi:hypothetical protein